MTPFKRSQLDWQGRSVKERIKGIQEHNHAMGVSCNWKEAKMQYQRLASDEIWVNDKYQVNIDRSIVSNNTSWIHLSIKTHNKEPARDWREFQQIKNELVVPEHEGIELYPADSRVVDTSNQFHIWVLADPKIRMPVGWQDGLQTNTESHGSKQRPTGEHHG